MSEQFLVTGIFGVIVVASILLLAATAVSTKTRKKALVSKPKVGVYQNYRTGNLIQVLEVKSGSVYMIDENGGKYVTHTALVANYDYLGSL